ncbi:poly-gamma-glutamate synthesis protein (capsule biosynthesis protein) [Hydrogenispora ethanolica]|uniref:Poly-gamma-glutamate synthesis protein (Capsule biosynthesis protein) n=2 Tax=Hydrogenispora ethanolica TaxID=1082276 RepID=A0A4R1QVX7_HYDET|nr:poly-gamma-glutamate synthesis protein (capsule biosynthesis protein) [Hydrogenispora ethanolica]
MLKTGDEMKGKKLLRFGLLCLALLCLSGSYGAADAPAGPEPGRQSATLRPAATVHTLMAVGDLNFATIADKLISNPSYPWVDTRELLRSATILVGNLEVPFSDRGAVYVPKKWLLRADPRTVASLTAAGFDLVTLANNHIMDFGLPALEDTLFTLNRAGIAHTGAGMNEAAARKPAFCTAPDGTRFAFLAYSQTFPEEFWAQGDRPGTAHANRAILAADIRKAKAQADLVIVSFHWGKELETMPAPYQKEFARLCIDAGASLVLGHHPHVLQGFEVYRGGLIAYSLGNFLFSTYSRRTVDSVILAVDFDRSGPVAARLYPVNVNNYEVAFQTRLRRGADAERVLRDLRGYSAEFQTPIASRDGLGIIRIPRQPRR